VQELMAVSEIVISERVGIEGPGALRAEARTENRVDLTLLENRPDDLSLIETADPLTGTDDAAGSTDDDSDDDSDSDDESDDESTDRDDSTDSDAGLQTGPQSPSELLPPELAWQERALCAQTDPEAFFPEKGGSTREAKRVCMSCEVRAECLDYALAKDERFGIWGGLSERERRRVKKQAV
jgi:WhiB family transcriptional regulator, redox-sensing transcriptional regulator